MEVMCVGGSEHPDIVLVALRVWMKMVILIIMVLRYA